MRTAVESYLENWGLSNSVQIAQTPTSEHANQPEQPLIEAASRVARELLRTEIERVVLHGDLHHKNIIESSSDGWLAIDPKGLYGERTYDLANLFYNPDDLASTVEKPERIESMAQTFAEELGIERSRILKFAFAYGGLSACWSIQDGLNPHRRLRIAGLIQQLL